MATRTGRWFRRFWTLTLATTVAVAGLAPAGLAAPGTGTGGPPGVAPAPADPMAKVETKVLDQLAKAGQATFWIMLRDRPDLTPAFAMDDWQARGRFVAERLQEAAERSQADVRAMLQKRGLQYRAFWSPNVIKVTGDEAAVRDLARMPQVARILADRVYRIPEPGAGGKGTGGQEAGAGQSGPAAEPGSAGAGLHGVEWNIDRIRADEVWATFAVRGAGIVVANIDTGVLYDHPALVRQYRGTQPDGSFDHNYNWFDPAGVCGNPSLAPCDNEGHGTHTMGTIVGDDGDPGPNRIGVAPHARWIAAKGCESFTCTLESLLAAGQWVLAPTDLSGGNPRPDLRPHVVNNSWGSPDGSDPFFREVVQNWVAAGIFPVFSNGNSGPGCGTAGAPASYPESYGVGAADIYNHIAFFSSRGPSPVDGGLKPNITAPGVDIRSAWNDGHYAVLSGTSMAAPHVAGAVALIWSAAPALMGDVAATRELLDRTAVDMGDLSCGGEAGNNNVWGQGLLDVFAAVDQAPRGPTGFLAGTVTDAATGAPIALAEVRAAGPVTRAGQTGTGGTYNLRLPTGTYDVTVRAFGYVAQAVSGVAVAEDRTTVRDFALAPAPRHAVSGYVRDATGNPLAGAVVTIAGTPVPPAVTDGQGFYRFAAVPEGEYTVRAEMGGCFAAAAQTVAVAGDTALDFALQHRVDGYGYFCHPEAAGFIDAGQVLGLSGDDQVAPVQLPFPFTFYGQTYQTAYVSTNGFLSFEDTPGGHFFNERIPTANPPNAAIYPFWDDLVVDGAASVRTALLGEAPHRRFVIEWRNVTFWDDPSGRLRFAVVLHENGHIQFLYADIEDNPREQGLSATVGIEGAGGTVAFDYSYNQAEVRSGLALRFRVPPSAFVQGTVSDQNDGQPVGGATVRAIQDGAVIREVAADAGGFYRLQLPLGTYTVEAGARHYETLSAPVTLATEGATLEQPFVLRTARAEVSPAALQVVVPPGETRTRTLTLRNTGSLATAWELREAGGQKVNTSSTLGLARNPAYNPDAPTTQGLYVGGTPAGWSPTAPGQVIRSFVPAGMQLPWGLGYTGNLWISDPMAVENHEFDPAGNPTGRRWRTPWAGIWPGDMAYDPGRGLICQVNVGGDNGIYCWDPETGAVVDSITGSFPWTSISQRGLAYRPDDDSFYIGGWNEGVIYHIKGLSHPDRGSVIGQCSPADGSISGLAWNPAFGVLWVATNSPTDTVYQLNPDTCAVLGTLAHPNPGYNGAGLEMDAAGNLWMVSQGLRTVYLVESGVPVFSDVTWLTPGPAAGTLAPGAEVQITVTLDARGLQPGVYGASLFLLSESGRTPTLRIPVQLIVPAYVQGVNAGGGAYTDTAGETWAADRAYTPGGWGYVQQSKTRSTRNAIAGTDDDPLYQDARVDLVDYKFDGLPAGVYEVDLRFAEIQFHQGGKRMYDVIIEDNLVLPAHDIAAEVGPDAADRHVFYVRVDDGQLHIRFVTRKGFSEPLVSAIRVTHRPDR